MKKRRALLLVIAIVMLLAAIWSYVLLVAPIPESLDQRVHDVASQLKCPVCQGESVADSPSTISQQMRAVIRQKLQQGQSQQQIIQYFVSRYGNSILWSPPRQGFTLLAWVIPIATLLCGALLLVLVLRGWLSGTPTADRSETGADTIEAAPIDSGELQQFQAQLEQELAADDPLFAHNHPTEAQQGKGDPRGRPRNTTDDPLFAHNHPTEAQQSKGDPRGRPGGPDDNPMFAPLRKEVNS